MSSIKFKQYKLAINATQVINTVQYMQLSTKNNVDILTKKVHVDPE